MHLKWLLLTAWPGLLVLAAMVPPLLPATPLSDPLHAWAGPVDPDRLTAWTNHQLEAQQQAIQQLLSVKGAPTLANTLVPYDRAIAALDAASSEAELLYAVSPSKAVRDAAESLVQTVSNASVALSLNQQVYRALAAVDASSADPATRYYLQRTLLEYRLAGVDKDAPTRERVQKLQEQITKLGLVFGRNVQEHVNTVTVSVLEELAGLPADFLARHKPAADGSIQLTTDYPDYMPVMTYAQNGSLRRRMFLAYNTRAYPANKQVLLDLLNARQELASTLGFQNWADLATADQMMGSAANVRQFLKELDVASRPDAAK